MIKFTLIYMGISVVALFIYRLVNYWLYYMEEKSKIHWFMIPISCLNFAFLLFSFPIVGVMIYITDELYEKDEKREVEKLTAQANLEGRQIGYEHGKSDGYYEGYQEGFFMGHHFATTQQDCSKERCEEISRFNTRWKISEDSDWYQIPKHHTSWAPYEKKHSEAYEHLDRPLV